MKHHRALLGFRDAIAFLFACAFAFALGEMAGEIVLVLRL